VPALAAALRDPDAGVRLSAAGALWEMREIEAAKQAIPALEAALDDTDLDVLVNVTGALQALDGDPSKYVPALRRIRDEGSCGDRIYAAKSLWGYGPPKDLFPAALECIGDRDPKVAEDASALLGRILKAGSDPVFAELLLEAAARSVGHERARYASLLGQLRAAPPESVPSLVRLAEDVDAETRRTSLVLLGRLRASARAAVPAISDLLLEDRNEDVRAAAATALAATAEPAEAVPALAQALQKDPSSQVRATAAVTLHDLGPAARDALPALEAALQDPDAGVRAAARRALPRVKATK
jgi:HEAT repeat protein